MITLSQLRASVPSVSTEGKLKEPIEVDNWVCLAGREAWHGSLPDVTTRAKFIPIIGIGRRRNRLPYESVFGHGRV